MISGGDGCRRLTVRVGDFDLWFEVPDSLPLTSGGEFLACAGLLPAMARGEPLVLPEAWPLDQVFHDNLERVQAKLIEFQDRLKVRLHRIEVVAALRAGTPPARAGAMAFFSGGVDGSYTALSNRERITALVLLRGIDMQLDNQSLWDRALESANLVAGHWGLPLATVSTNIRFLGYHYGLKWAHTFQGAGLAALAHLTPFEQTLIAASHSLEDMTGFASHPDLDILWASSVTAVEHDGAIRRTAKIAELVTDPVVLSRLRVCWHDQGYNCCRCEKCLRTMIALRLLGAPMPSFSEGLDLGLIGMLGTDQGGRVDYIRELDDLEREHPGPEIRVALDRLLASERRRSVLRRLDRATGGLLSSVKPMVRR
ncbi:MAG TPA: hypothetical protein PLL69_04900 [Gemmatimonadales bacterium]|nr:hypothetical protein [Gemmatimonadales bacterium]